MTNDRLRHDPSDPADTLNAALDGDRATPSPDVEALLDTARLVRASLDPNESATAPQIDAMWSDIVRAASPHSSLDDHAKETGMSTAERTRVLGIVAIQPGSSRRRSGLRAVGSWISMAAVAAVLIATASMAWSLRPGGDDGHLLASATSLAVGTAHASPSPVATAGDDWLRWPEPADCDVAPMSHEDYAKIMQMQPDISGRSYEVAGIPTQADAIAAADVARRQYACAMFEDRERQRTLSSPAFTFFQSYSSARTLTDEQLSENRIADSMRLSVNIPALEPTAYTVVMESDPPPALWDAQQFIITSKSDGLAVVTYDPGKAVLLADGRIAIPGTYLTWSAPGSGGTATPIPMTWFSTALTILEQNDAGIWLVDETSLIYCPFQECSAVWENVSRLWQVPIPTLDVPVPWTIPTGTATPVASPAVSLDSRKTATPATPKP